MTPIDTEALARQFYAALTVGDRAALDALLHPGFVGHATEGLPFDLGGEYVGPEAMRRGFWGKIAKNFDARAVPDDFRLLDDGRLFVHGTYSGVARSSGAALDAEFVHLLQFEGAQISGLRQVTDSARWVRAGSTASTFAAPAPEMVQFSLENGLATLRLNRPEVHNAIDANMAEGLYAAALRCANEPSLRAVLILGNGRSFTVGGDLSFIAAAKSENLPALLRSMTGPYHEALRTFSRLEAPIVAGVQGAAAGGGLGMLYCADIVLLADNAKIATGFGALGLSMDGANSWFLPRLVGLRRAAELYFEERVLDAREALDWGLANRVVPAGELEALALASATRLANGPTRAYGEVRRLFKNSLDATLSEQLGSETEALCRTAATADATGAIASFLTKTKPVFAGR